MILAYVSEIPVTGKSQISFRNFSKFSSGFFSQIPKSTIFRYFEGNLVVRKINWTLQYNTRSNKTDRKSERERKSKLPEKQFRRRTLLQIPRKDKFSLYGLPNGKVCKKCPSRRFRFNKLSRHFLSQNFIFSQYIRDTSCNHYHKLPRNKMCTLWEFGAEAAAKCGTFSRDAECCTFSHENTPLTQIFTIIQ